MPKSFSLHVKSSLKFPEQTETSISYGPSTTIKLEGNRICIVDTGIRISNCNNDGYVIVEPYSGYADKLSFNETKLDSTSKQSVVIEIKNNTKEFTRIDPDNYLFTFKFVQKEKKPVKNYKRAAPKVIVDNDSQEKNKIIVKKAVEAVVQQEVKTVEEPSVEEPSVEEPSVEEPSVEIVVEAPKKRGRRKKVVTV
jgi:hypothetical protein